jgi:propanol-preferring alcohol dehydrogenase
MERMAAYQVVAWGQPGEFVEVDVPRPGPGEVLVQTAAVGLCHSDLDIMDGLAADRGFDPPFTLGHETAGLVAELGADAAVFTPGDRVLVSGVHSCGRCVQCLKGQDNYCWRPRSMRTRGVGDDGGLASYVVVPERELVRLEQLTPVQAAPLADAGATSYHAVKAALARLVPGSTALVIGVGGLGGFAVQYLRLLSPARVVAIDIAGQRLEYAREVGAHAAIAADGSERQRIFELTSGSGCDAVFDFVGTDSTLGLACAVAAPLGRVAVCGKGPGAVSFGWGRIAPGCDLALSLGSTLADLREVVALCEQGSVRVESELFSFDETGDAYERLRSGELRSRAVVVLS